MADRYDELATETFDTWAKDNHLSHFHQLVPYGLLIKLYADALRSVADAARREENEACAMALCKICRGDIMESSEFGQPTAYQQQPIYGKRWSWSKSPEWYHPSTDGKYTEPCRANPIRTRLSAPATQEADELVRVRAERDELRETLKGAATSEQLRLINDGITHLKNEIAIAEAEAAAMRDVLKLVEYVHSSVSGNSYCPICQRLKPHHDDNCELKIALSSTAGARVLRVVEAARRKRDADRELGAAMLRGEMYHEYHELEVRVDDAALALSVALDALDGK